MLSPITGAGGRGFQISNVRFEIIDAMALTPT
jgi:hypothetical protein